MRKKNQRGKEVEKSTKNGALLQIQSSKYGLLTGRGLRRWSKLDLQEKPDKTSLN
jgi:hypothetical protein